jgi:hypothetical protein
MFGNVDVPDGGSGGGNNIGLSLVELLESMAVEVAV